MQDDQQVQNQQSNQAPLLTHAAQKVIDQTAPPPQVPTPPAPPIPSAPPSSAPTKEHAPAPIADVQVQEVAQAPELSAELKEAGVEEGADAKEEELPEDVKNAGVTAAKESTPLVSGAIPLQPVLKLPMTYEEVLLEEKKEKSASNSLSWKIREILREWKKQLFST